MSRQDLEPTLLLPTDSDVSPITGRQQDPQPWEGRQIVLILCGLVGSGKSTFALELQRYFPQFLRCSQDDLGTRRDVENLAREALRTGMSVCIDRTNFNAQQRSYWIEIAGQFPGTLVWLIVFNTPYEICAARLRERTSHPTITSPEHGLSVLARFAHDFRYPHSGEGYNCILYLSASGQPGRPTYSQSDVSGILQRLWVSSAAPMTPRIARSLNGPQQQQRWNGRNDNGRYRHPATNHLPRQVRNPAPEFPPLGRQPPAVGRYNRY